MNKTPAEELREAWEGSTKGEWTEKDLRIAFRHDAIQDYDMNFIVAALKHVPAVLDENARLQAAHNHQYGVAGTLLREAERVGRENERLRELLKHAVPGCPRPDICDTCAEIESLLKEGK